MADKIFSARKELKVSQIKTFGKLTIVSGQCTDFVSGDIDMMLCVQTVKTTKTSKAIFKYRPVMLSERYTGACNKKGRFKFQSRVQWPRHKASHTRTV